MMMRLGAAIGLFFMLYLSWHLGRHYEWLQTPDCDRDVTADLRTLYDSPDRKALIIDGIKITPSVGGKHYQIWRAERE